MVLYPDDEVVGIVERDPNGEGTKLIPDCPLTNVKINATLGLNLAKVNITHAFSNTSRRAIEAIYTFPLPPEAQVTGFHATLNGVTIEGDFEEKDEAYAQNEQATRKGDTAFLLESHREDIFQLSLGNIGPGEHIQITTTYLQPIEQQDDEIRWIIPTVVAPRYIPGQVKGPKIGPGTAAPSDSVPDADFITPPRGDALYALDLNITLQGIPGIKKVASPSHQIELELIEDGYKVNLARAHECLDSDFILNLTVREEQSNVIIWGKTENGTTYGTLQLCPNEDDLAFDSKRGMLIYTALHPDLLRKEYTFLIDVSGSMAGEKLVQAKRALKVALRNLQEGDVFNIVAFESGFDRFATGAVAFNQVNLERADKWIEQLEDMGGTEILKPLKWALEQRYKDDQRYFSQVLFLFTDGEVGNEREIYALLDEYADQIRLFPFGIDTAVNESFIRGLAKHGNGTPEFVYPGERIENKLMRQFEHILNDGFFDLEIDQPDGAELELAAPLPQAIYFDEVVHIPFRIHHKGERPGAITIGGMHGNHMPQPQSITVNVGIKGDNDLLKKAFAKATISELENQLDQTSDRRALGIEKEIVRTSIEAGILSTKTSLIAIYRRKHKLPGVPDTITVPVAMPRMWADEKEDFSGIEKYSLAYSNEFALADMHVMKNLSVAMQSSDSLETLIHDVIQLQHADGTIDGDIDWTINFIIAMKLVGKKHQTTYRIPIQKAEMAVDPGLLATMMAKNTLKPKELLREILD